MKHRSYHIARQARFNNCPILQIHKDYNLKGQTQWEIFISTDKEAGGFRELVCPTLKEAKEVTNDIKDKSDGFIQEIIIFR